MLIPILIILLVLYISFLIFRKKGKDLGQKRINQLRFIHFALFGLLLIIWFLATKEVFIRGYWTTKIFIWSFIISAIALFVFGKISVRNKIERFYYGVFFYFPLTLIPLLFIPFIGTGITLGVYGFTIGDGDDILYSNNRFRIQQTYNGFMGPRRNPDLFVKKGIFEFKEPPLKMDYIYKLDSINIKEKSASEIIISFYHKDTDVKSPFQLNVELTKL